MWRKHNTYVRSLSVLLLRLLVVFILSREAARQNKYESTHTVLDDDAPSSPISFINECLYELGVDHGVPAMNNFSFAYIWLRPSSGTFIDLLDSVPCWQVVFRTFYSYKSLLCEIVRWNIVIGGNYVCNTQIMSQMIALFVQSKVTNLDINNLFQLRIFFSNLRWPSSALWHFRFQISTFYFQLGTHTLIPVTAS